MIFMTFKFTLLMILKIWMINAIFEKIVYQTAIGLARKGSNMEIVDLLSKAEKVINHNDSI